MEECKLSGVCCKIFYINISKEEYASRKFKTQFEDMGHIEDFEEAQSYGANVLAKKEDGSCIYLKDNLCSIHKDRPLVCREFFCTSTDPKFSEMVKTVWDEKEKLGLPH